jgi:antibiotic biosynthesis monooxygenase (ABM) superfamily enzyme
MQPPNQLETREEGPVTIVVSRRIKPNREADYEAWAAGVCAVATQFAGHQGVTILRPSGRARPEYVLIFRFDTYAHLKAWEDSTVRAEWLERVADMTVDQPSVRKLTGLEYWFTLPDQPGVPPPPRHKMAMVTLLAVFPLSTAITLALREWLEGLHFLLRGLTMSVLLVLLMTYLVMPFLTRLLARWLFPQRYQRKPTS